MPVRIRCTIIFAMPCQSLFFFNHDRASFAAFGRGGCLFFLLVAFLAIRDDVCRLPSSFPFIIDDKSGEDRILIGYIRPGEWMNNRRRAKACADIWCEHHHLFARLPRRRWRSDAGCTFSLWLFIFSPFHYFMSQHDIIYPRDIFHHRERKSSRRRVPSLYIYV